MTWAFKVEAKAGDDIEITLYDVIGKDFFGDGISAKDVLDALRKSPKAKRIILRVNSIGGIVTEAFAMVNALTERREAGAEVVAYVDGIAASAAAYLLTAASRVVMPENAFIMIHRVRGGGRGNADEIATVADLMRRMDEQLARAFAAMSARRGKSKTEADYLASFASGDRYLDASEAIEWGFADEVAPALQAAASMVDPSELDGPPGALLEQPYVARAVAKKDGMPAHDPDGSVSVLQDGLRMLSGHPISVTMGKGASVPMKGISNQKRPDNMIVSLIPVANIGNGVAGVIPAAIKNASAADGGAPTTPKGSKKMTKEELKSQHPELYAAVYAEGVASTLDRVSAHLELGEASGDMKTAIEAAKSGAEMTQTLTAKYLAAGMRRNEQTARQAESDEAGKAVAGAAGEPAAEDYGDRVVKALKAQKGGA
jgi:ATP-dependent Clp protease protease subunit